LLLSEGKVDAFIGDTASISYTSKKLGLENLTVAAPTDYRFELSFGVRKDWLELIPILNKFIESIPSQEKRAIEQGWLNMRVQKQTNWSEVWRWGLIVSGIFTLVLVVIFVWNRRLGREITERKKAVEALTKSERRFREIFEQSPFGIALIGSLTGHIYELNPKFAEIAGRTVEEMINTDWMSITHPNDVQEDLDNMALLNAGKINGFNMDKRYIRPDGSHVWINMTIAPVAVEDKAHPRHLCMIDDITEQKEAAEERKQLQAQLQQAQKMEAIATLAGGVAHEFNNTLMGIMGNIELLKMNFSEDGGIDKYLEAMKSAGHRMSRLTDQLLAYAEGGKYQPKDLKMDDFVMETLPILHHDLSPEVKVETHFPKDISYIRADYAQMQMVLSAIFTNSNEAIEDEGLIRITAENKNVDVDFAEQHHDLKPGPYVCLTIEDDGKGMDEETKDGIFEPFFTTKFQGRGMGMAAVYGIVKNHDGWISVDSELGKGTTVQIYLPAIEVEVEKPKKAKAEVATGSGTILMIEDEDVVIEVTQAMLEMLGYRVMVAKTGKDAIHIAETFDGQIDLALLDIKLPDMEGGKVYPHIMKARPDLKVIVFSGYSIEGPARKILDAGAQDFIQKPFSLATLSEKLKEVLEGKKET